MYYELEGLGRYYTAYSSDFAAKIHARASNKDVIVDIFDDSNKNVSRKVYHPSSKIELIF